jgi:hypothetical protein
MRKRFLDGVYPELAEGLGMTRASKIRQIRQIRHMRQVRQMRQIRQVGTKSLTKRAPGANVQQRDALN